MKDKLSEIDNLAKAVQELNLRGFEIGEKYEFAVMHLISKIIELSGS